MGRAVKAFLTRGRSVPRDVNGDEPDRAGETVHVSRLDVVMYVSAILGHLIDLAVDINVAVRYYIGGLFTEFYWTLAFILLPAIINTAISIRMYAQDKPQDDSVSNTFTKRRALRLLMLVFQMAPILRFTDALIYAVRCRRAERNRDTASQRRYYRLMLKEDSDAALLRLAECFLEAAPQQVLQLTFLYRRMGDYEVHQTLSIISSVVSMGWCLAAYQRAIRFAQEDKQNMNWVGTLLQILWHFFVTLSRVTAISTIAYINPHWTVLACVIHVFTMATWLQFFDRSPFCGHHRVAELAFAIVMGMIYIFTYVIPVEGRTRYRYAIYYSVCFMENATCAIIWVMFVDHAVKDNVFLFHTVLAVSVVPFLIGMVFMVIYYLYFHPRVRKGTVSDNITVRFKHNNDVTELS